MSNARLSGPERAALVLLGLDEDVAAQVLAHLNDQDLRRLAECSVALEPIPVDALIPTLEEFEKKMKEPLPPNGAGEYMLRLTARTVGDDRAKRLFSPTVTSPQAIDTIRLARAATLAELLSEEHPQVAAVIVSQLQRDQAARVVAAMTPERQTEIVTRISSLEEIPSEVLQLASEALAKALASAGGLSESRSEFDGVAFAAAILNDLPPSDTERVLGELEANSVPTMPQIREAMFTFDNLEKLDVRAVQVLMKDVPSEQLLMALKTASEVLRDHFLSAISSRAAAALRDDLAAMPPTRLSEVEKAQRAIVEVAMRLASEGRIVLPGSTSEKLV